MPGCKKRKLEVIRMLRIFIKAIQEKDSCIINQIKIYIMSKTAPAGFVRVELWLKAETADYGTQVAGFLKSTRKILFQDWITQKLATYIKIVKPVHQGKLALDERLSKQPLQSLDQKKRKPVRDKARAQKAPAGKRQSRKTSTKVIRRKKVVKPGRGK